MAKLADALDSGSSARKGVEVQILSRAPFSRRFPLGGGADWLHNFPMFRCSLILVVTLLISFLTSPIPAWSADKSHGIDVKPPEDMKAVSAATQAHQSTNKWWKDSEMQKGIQLHDKGVLGDEKAVTDAFAIFEKKFKDEPDNALAEAYMGSAFTLKSRDAFPGPDKWNFLQSGIKHLDEGVRKAPTDVYVRLVRAMNYWHLPFIFGKKGQSLEDFKELLTQIEAKPDQYAPDLKQAVYYYGGLALKDDGKKDEAGKMWIKGLEQNVESPFKEKIVLEIKRINVPILPDRGSKK